MPTGPQTPEHITNRVDGRRATGAWFHLDDIGQRIREGQEAARDAMTEEEKAAWHDTRAAQTSAQFKGKKQSPEHIKARVEARKAKNGGKWFTAEDIGERIRQGKKEGFNALTEEAKEVKRQAARDAGKSRAVVLEEKPCEWVECKNTHTNDRFCSTACRNKVIKAYQNGYEKLGEYRTCPTDGVIFWVEKKNLLDVNYCSRPCYAKSRTGEKNSNWRNGSTPANKILRDSPEGRQWREAVLARDEYRCQGCGTTERLDAHHIKPFAYHPDLRFDVNNGLTLCRSCHEATHGHRIGASTGESHVEITCGWDNKKKRIRRTKVKEINFCSKSCARSYQHWITRNTRYNIGSDIT